MAHLTSLRCEEVDKPVPKDDEVLIKVRAASINPLDWRLMKGEPRVIRILSVCEDADRADRVLM